MAVNITKNGIHDHYDVCKFVADFESDIAAAPVNYAPGSTIFCIETSTTYVLSPEREWVKYN